MKRLSRFSLLAIGCLAVFSGLSGQNLRPMDSVSVISNGFPLAYPFVGGLNLPQFSPIDLNMDGTDDLLIFDRAGDKVLTFLNGGTPGTVDYDFAPEYQAGFPEGMRHYCLAADFDCDGKADLFTSANDGLRVFRNNSSGNGVSFSLQYDTLFTDKGAGSTILLVPSTDIPALVDLDGDSDLDILTFNPGGSYVEFHRNNAVENNGNCNSLEMSLAEECWGHFYESGQGAEITLNVTCRTNGSGTSGAVHAGSTLAAFDEEGDGDYDLVIGDLITDTLIYLRNGGTPTSALMDTAISLFPRYDVPVKLDLFIGAYFMDVNNDGKVDMLAAPNAENIAANVRNSWYYQNVDTGNGVRLSQNSTRFLQKDMIDVGSGAYPAFFDHNNDGLMDFVIGNVNRKISVNNIAVGLSLYENVGTATQPAFALVTDDYAGMSGIFGASLFGITPTLGDLDNDGDMDMLIGNNNGTVHYFENIAPAGQDANFVLSQANYKGIDVGNFSAPCLVDIDRDGKLDLVIGETSGNLNYYRNIGTAAQADFGGAPDDSFWGAVDADEECCSGYSVPFVVENPSTNKYDLYLGTEKKGIYYYADIESQYGDTFLLVTDRFGGLWEGERTAVAAVDLNQDNKLEYLIGNLRGGLGLYEVDPFVAAEAPATELLDRLDLFPNPSRGALQVRSHIAGAKELEVTVFDLQGKIMARAESPVTRSLELDTHQWPGGLYLVSFQVDGKYVGSKKWVLRR